MLEHFPHEPPSAETFLCGQVRLGRVHSHKSSSFFLRKRRKELYLHVLRLSCSSLLNDLRNQFLKDRRFPFLHIWTFLPSARVRSNCTIMHDFFPIHICITSTNWRRRSNTNSPGNYHSYSHYAPWALHENIITPMASCYRAMSIHLQLAYRHKVCYGCVTRSMFIH